MKTALLIFVVFLQACAPAGYAISAAGGARSELKFVELIKRVEAIEAKCTRR